MQWICIANKQWSCSILGICEVNAQLAYTHTIEKISCNQFREIFLHYLIKWNRSQVKVEGLLGDNEPHNCIFVTKYDSPCEVCKTTTNMWDVLCNCGKVVYNSLKETFANLPRQHKDIYGYYIPHFQTILGRINISVWYQRLYY